MRWWYNNTYGNWNDFEDVAYAITSDVIRHLENHTVDDYYIYNENGLYKVLKGCELDPLTVYAHNWTERQKIHAQNCKLFEYGNSFEEKWDHISMLVYGIYERTDEDIQHIKLTEDIIEKRELRIQKRLNNISSEVIKEYELKMNFNIPMLNEKKVYPYSNDKYDLEDIKDILKKICNFKDNKQNFYCVVGINTNYDIMGFIKFSIINNDIYKFLLLLGCTKYIVIQNDYDGNDFCTDTDKTICNKLWNSYSLIDIQLLRFYRITKNRDINVTEEHIKI